MAQRVLMLVMKRAAHEVRAAANVADALAVAAEFKPDVLLLDWWLPDGTGLDVANTVQAERPGIGIVFLSALAPDKLRAESVNVHPAAILQKPASVETIQKSVATAAA